MKLLVVHLTGSFEVISGRLLKRKGHFMSPELLQSQFDTLEPPSAPENFIQISVDKNLSEIIATIIETLKWSENHLYQWSRTQLGITLSPIPNHVPVSLLILYSRFFLRWINHNVLRYACLGGFLGICDTLVSMLWHIQRKGEETLKVKLQLNFKFVWPNQIIRGNSIIYAVNHDLFRTLLIMPVLGQINETWLSLAPSGDRSQEQKSVQNWPLTSKSCYTTHL